MDKADITIIGAGIIGLAVARQLSRSDRTVFVIEKNKSFGMETSSRNSEVVHSGLYYPSGSLKHRLCIEGNGQLYAICRREGINFRRTGKLVVAVAEEELDDLNALYTNGRKNGVPGLELISGTMAGNLEPSVECIQALLVPTTGIIDSHRVMEYFLGKARERGTEFVYNARVEQIRKGDRSGYVVVVSDADGTIFEFESEIVVNCAGLDSDTVAEMAGINVQKEGYRLKYCKGSYFRIREPENLGISHLVYPAVRKDSISLGVHVTPDLGGGIRLGPDAEYLWDREKDYRVDENKREEFYVQTEKFIPRINMDDLYPDTAGIRPKLQGAGESFRDFIIKEEEDKGLKNFINLIGIESPGLTAASAIGEMVKDLL